MFWRNFTSKFGRKFAWKFTWKFTRKLTRKYNKAGWFSWLGCLWGLIKMKRSMGVNWAYRVTRGFAHCHMEHAEGPSAPFFESPHSLSTITSVSLPIYTFKTRLFRIEQNKNTKKTIFWIFWKYKKTKREWLITFHDQTMFKTLLVQLNLMIPLTVHGYEI